MTWPILAWRSYLNIKDRVHRGSLAAMEIRLTTPCRRTVVKVFLQVVLFFLLSRCYADVDQRVRDLQNNQTTGIILSVDSEKISGTALEIEASNTNKTLLSDKEAYGIILSVYTKLLTLEEDSKVIRKDYIKDYQNVVELSTGVFIATTGGTYLLNFRGIDNKGRSLRIKSSSTSIAILLVNDIVRATSYANPGDRNIASLSVVVHLERGDRVHIVVSGAGPFLSNATDDDDNYYTQFSGAKLGLNK